MAIEIIPKPEVKKPTSLMNFLFFGGILLLILVIGGYFYLQNTIKNSSENLKNLERNILEKSTPEVKNLEKEIYSWSQKIEDYNILFGSHQTVSGLFELLERVTHPKVWWTDFNFDTSTSKNLKLKGISQDFQTLQQQLFILEKEVSIKNIILNRVSLGKEGVEFELEISIDPELFKPKSSLEI